MIIFMGRLIEWLSFHGKTKYSNKLKLSALSNSAIGYEVIALVPQRNNLGREAISFPLH